MMDFRSTVFGLARRLSRMGIVNAVRDLLERIGGVRKVGL